MIPVSEYEEPGQQEVTSRRGDEPLLLSGNLHRCDRDKLRLDEEDKAGGMERVSGTGAGKNCFRR